MMLSPACSYPDAGESLLGFSFQKLARVYRLAHFPDLEMEFYLICVGITHFGNFLAFLDRLSFFDR
ncbi:hypothetical protein D3C71_2023980 [compost metagenome]